MDLDLARWQFAITTVYHFQFVPLTIGLSLLVAGLQTTWYATRDERWLRATKFWGKLFLINFAMGVVTGIVQEFQFGMNWSDYSRFAGDVFGAPLAIEGLLAFGMFLVAISAWNLVRGRHREVFHPSIRVGLWTTLAGSLGVVLTGDLQARLMTQQQPMKMAAAEALYDTVAPASFSVFTIGSLDGTRELWSPRVPRLLSFLATGTWDGEVAPGVVTSELAAGITDPTARDAMAAYRRHAIAPEAVADAVAYAVGTSPEIDVNEILVRPVRQR